MPDRKLKYERKAAAAGWIKVNLRLPPDLAQRLADHCESAETTQSETIRRALAEYLARREIKR